MALHCMSVTVSKSIFKFVSMRKPLRIVFWSLRYLLSWHLNIQIVLHYCWRFILISKLFHEHMFYLPQLDCKIFEFRWCVTFYFTPIIIAVGNLGILYLLVITNWFCFIGHWQVKFFLTQMCFAQAESELNWTKMRYSLILFYLQSKAVHSYSFFFF